MAALLFAWLLLWGEVVSQPKCPPLRETVVPIYKELSYADVAQEQPKKGYPGFSTTTISLDGKVYNATIATITISGVNAGEFEIGTRTDESAVAFNKKVEQCRIANGEF